MSSAGLILLQDALEIVFLAMLVELDIDEQKTLESKSFDELIGELKKCGVPVPKSGTLKALNKQRVITKHYGQLAEPLTVQTYSEAADVAIEAVVQAVLGTRYREIFLADLLAEGEAKALLTAAAEHLQQSAFLEALIAVRKALFVEIEIEYCVHEWRDAEPNERISVFALIRRGRKAPSWTRNRKWIEENVSSPFDYIQIDSEKLRIDAMEWGVNTAELSNLRRLTPDVFREGKNSEWKVRYDLEFPKNEATAANARYCLDRAISILLRKQQHATAHRWPGCDVGFDPPPIYLDAPVFSKARQDSEVVHRINNQFEYILSAIVSGFVASEKYYTIHGHRAVEGKEFGTDRAEWIIQGFLLVQGDA
jgi:hypothetical protein